MSVPVALRDADAYAHQLREEGAVIASFGERRAEIERQLKAAAALEHLAPIDDPDLLDEVTALVERRWPLWPNAGDRDPRPPAGAGYRRIEPVTPRDPAVPASAPGALRSSHAV